MKCGHYIDMGRGGGRPGKGVIGQRPSTWLTFFYQFSSKGYALNALTLMIVALLFCRRPTTTCCTRTACKQH